ncbi:Uncharacterised protein [Vibrio cholerae]|nr:Uncharacterised protein [Vibrio cholerae]CSB54604.1 Uncharacterised protein [Vibrio cholerae]CSB57447.1 Uncharacterised protein [Vibrio cholerae]CSC38511.1 Uncharacterised protein [Vibrio cholerae]CSC42072.1 Uncharacterised protein [Vibrio cholerae]
MALTHFHIQTHAIHLTKGDIRQSLVEHANSVLLTLNGFADDAGYRIRTDRQTLFTLSQLFGQTSQFHFHLFNRFDRIVSANDVLTNALTQMLIHGNVEQHFTLRA